MDRTLEAALLVRCQSGDASALRELYDEHATGLLRYLERLLGDAGAAEDVCQEAFLRLWRRSDQFDPERGRFGAWLFRAASNLAYNRMSVRKARESVLDPSYDRKDEAAPEPMTAASDEEKREALMGALDRLSPQDRAILTLRHLEERPVAEVAHLLGIPEGTVKSRAFYAVRRLRTFLDQLFGRPEEVMG